MQCGAWQALSTTAQALYVWLKLEWKGPRANNNGKISLSLRQAAERLGVTKETAGRAFRDLQAKGFIVVTKLAHLGCEGEAQSPLYELTELALPHQQFNRPRALYKSWTAGNDFEVVTMKPNNPTGKGGKNKSPS